MGRDWKSDQRERETRQTSGPLRSQVVLNPPTEKFGSLEIGRFWLLNPARGSMFIVRQAGGVELRQEFHVYARYREHLTPDGVRIAPGRRTINIALLTEGHPLLQLGVFKVFMKSSPTVSSHLITPFETR
jgi:hypothetical protein